MVRRHALARVQQRLRDFPAVALVGPRQSGKTTLARSLGGEYFDLEQATDRLRLNLAWDDLVDGSDLVVLDEAQAWPDVFRMLRAAVDRERRRRGRFLLLGSVSPALMREVSESLAGRLALVELRPFVLGEVPRCPTARLWTRGGFPDGGVLSARSTAFPVWQRDYLTLLAQRDLPLWGLSSKPQETLRLLRMLAAANGQIWNASQLGQSLGLSYHTVNGHLDYLEGAFLIRRLAPWHRNVGKRLVKSPKVYWRDCGLLHALLGVTDEQTLLAQPWVGASWEGFVIEQILGLLDVRGMAVEPTFLRTSDQHELDLVLDFGRKVWAVEVKLTASPGPADMARLDKVADLVGADLRILVSQVRRSAFVRGRASCNLADLRSKLGELAAS